MFCTQPFNHIDVIVENEKVQLQPCNVWSSKRHSIIDYQKNIQEIQNTLKENYYYPGCETCFREDKNNIRSRRVAQNQFSNDNNLSTKKLDAVRRCSSQDYFCEKISIEKLKHFVSKEAFNIDGLGKKIIENFWRLKLIKYPHDIFRLDYDKIETLEGWGKLSVENLKYSINEKKIFH